MTEYEIKNFWVKTADTNGSVVLRRLQSEDEVCIWLDKTIESEEEAWRMLVHSMNHGDMFKITIKKQDE